MKLNKQDAKTKHAAPKRILTLLLAAVLVLSLSIAAYAAWNVHAARQQALRADLQIEENNAHSYVEYPVPREESAGMVLLSAVNDGQEERVYVNVSPVTPEEAAAFGEDLSFFWSIPGTEVGGFAAPQLPSDLVLEGQEAVRDAVMQYAYDEASQTMTVQCYLDVSRVREAAASLDVQEFPLLVTLYRSDTDQNKEFGPISFSLTEEQRRTFDFGGAVYHDDQLDKEIELVNLELSPFSAIWRVRYDLAEQFHQPNADWDAYQDWSALEDKICIEAQLVFSDGSSFSTGGVLAAPIEDGLVNLHCSWGRAIDINDIQRIVLGDLVLWEAA